MTGEQGAALLGERVQLVRLCLGLTGDASAAEDLAQEALLVAWQQEQALRDPEKRTQWLNGIARNLCRHWWRRQGLERGRLATAPEGGLAEGGDRASGIDLETDLERSELLELLDRALALLPAETRAVVVLSDAGDNSGSLPAVPLRALGGLSDGGKGPSAVGEGGNERVHGHHGGGHGPPLAVGRGFRWPGRTGRPGDRPPSSAVP